MRAREHIGSFFFWERLGFLVRIILLGDSVFERERARFWEQRKEAVREVRRYREKSIWKGTHLSSSSSSSYPSFLMPMKSFVRQRHQQLFSSYLGKRFSFYICTHMFKFFMILIWNFCKEVKSYFYHSSIMLLKSNILSLFDI